MFQSSELRISNGVSCCHLGANLESRADSTDRSRVHHVFEKVNRKSKAFEFGLRYVLGLDFTPGRFCCSKWSSVQGLNEVH